MEALNTAATGPKACALGLVRHASRALADPTVKPPLDEFRSLAERGNVVPLYAQLATDFESPLSAFLKIRDGKHAFLFESAESTDASGRWSIMGSNPRAVFEARGMEISVTRGSEVVRHTAERDGLGRVGKVHGAVSSSGARECPAIFWWGRRVFGLRRGAAVRADHRGASDRRPRLAGGGLLDRRHAAVV